MATSRTLIYSTSCLKPTVGRKRVRTSDCRRCAWVPGYETVFPDLNRVNPEYFKYVDRKIDYLNEQGFVPFIEVSRRDASEVWKKYYGWPDSYARFIQY